MISLSIATYAVVVARKNQKRNKLFLYYQYELERIERILVRKARQLDIVKTPKEKVEIYDSLFKHQEAIDKILNKMKDDFSLVDR